MRKEQHKVLQEKQKQHVDNRNEHLDADIILLLANSADGNNMNGSKSDKRIAASLSYNDSSRSSLHVQAPVSRPLVPPGFRSALVDKNLPVQSSSSSITPEVPSKTAILMTIEFFFFLIEE